MPTAVCVYTCVFERQWNWLLNFALFSAFSISFLGGRVAKGERGRREQCLGQLADTLQRGELTRHRKAACWVSG